MATPRLPPAVKALLAREQIEPAQVEAGAAPGSWQVRGTRWVAVSLPGRAVPLHVALPVHGRVARLARGRYEAQFAPPAPDELAEAQAFAASVLAHAQVHGQVGARATASHAIEVDAAGREKLVRRGFSAR